MIDSASTHFGSFRKKAALRFTLMATLWLGLSGLDWKSWVFGLPVVVISTWLSLRLGGKNNLRWSISGLLYFAWYFTVQSISGGWDVALRAFGPRDRLNPGLLSYPIRLPPGHSQLFFCAIVSLLPGTLVVSILDSTASIHVLDLSDEHEQELVELENRVFALFALEKSSDSEKKMP